MPAGPVLDVEQCFDNEQVKTLPVVQYVNHPRLGERYPVVGHGVNLERTPPSMRSATPDLGQHNDEVLDELGFTEAQIAEFRQSGVI